MAWNNLFEVIWFDSLGAKSASILLKGDSCDILVDPGAASMQPSYPLPPEEKKRLREQALKRIANNLGKERVKAVVITHYHYDHFPHPGEPLLPLRLFKGKTIVAKDPNSYINESQWKRAREFYGQLLGSLGIKEIYEEPLTKNYKDPLDELPIASSKNFPGYDNRREELLAKGRIWFTRLTRLWSEEPWIREIKGESINIIWADAKRLNICGINIEFTRPWFHGVEYDRTGWVIGFKACRDNTCLFYTSDVMGPVIEDYASYIARVKPDIVILDGPPTYLYPYMFNKINLSRAVNNAIEIINSEPSLIIYDHHLLREKKWRKRVEQVLRHAARKGVTVQTAAEYIGRRPLIDTL